MPRPRAVLFDLLTALIDSWSLWDRVAGSDGRRWRTAYLRNTYAEPAYRPYADLVREAAVEEGLPPNCADRLLGCYDELAPWPEAGEFWLRSLRIFRWRLSPIARNGSGEPPQLGSGSSLR